MTSEPRRRVPLAPSYEPLAIVSNRRIFIQNLVNLLHLSILRRDWQRGYRVWAILIRCPEVDYKSSWHWGLSILTHLPLEAYSDPDLNDAERQAERSEKKESYLRRLLQTVQREKRPDILQTLILTMIYDEHYDKALEELDLYLPSYPYISSASLQTYAGLLCFWLSLPQSARGGSISLFDALTQPLSESKSSTEREPTTPIPSRFKSSLRSPSAAPLDSSSSATSSSPAPAIERKHVEQLMDKTMLRRAMGYFQSAMDIEKDADEGRKEETDEAGTREGMVSAYLEKIREMLLEPSSPERDDIESSIRSHYSSRHDSQDEGGVDGADDEDYSINSDLGDELDLDEYGLPLKRELQSSMAQDQALHTSVRKGRKGGEDDDADEKEEYSDTSFD